MNDPSAENLRQIKTWPDFDCEGLLEFVSGIWCAPYGFWRRIGCTYWLSTGGWSGNETLIEALQSHPYFWALCWISSRRGGHYQFILPKYKPE